MGAQNPQKALAEIQSYFAKRRQAQPEHDEGEARVLLTQACVLIERHAPPDSTYRTEKDKAIKRIVVGAGNVRRNYTHLEEVDPILQALQEAYENGQIERPQESADSALARIERVLNRFHKVAQKLARRHGGKKPLKISDEYDVQDLLKALFAIDFDDVRPEEWTPSHAGSSGKRMDLLFKEHGIVVEVKKTRDTLRDKGIGEELLIDIAHYKEHPNCQTLVCFVYDPDQLITNPVGLKRDLEHHTTSALNVSVIICQG
jgi:hypothetical protein